MKSRAPEAPAMLAFALVPILAQLLYTASTAPYLVRLVRAKRSDQHSLVCMVMILAAHTVMMGWSLAYVAHVGLALSYAGALLVTAIETVIIVYYRRRPGGAPASVRTSPVAAPTPADNAKRTV